MLYKATYSVGSEVDILKSVVFLCSSVFFRLILETSFCLLAVLVIFPLLLQDSACKIKHSISFTSYGIVKLVEDTVWRKCYHMKKNSNF